MGWSNNRITHGGTKIAPDGSGDIQIALESPLTSQISLFGLPSVNIWAKYKPFKYNGIFDTDAARVAALATTQYGLGGDLNQLPKTTNTTPGALTSLQNYYDSSMDDAKGKPLNGWSYNRPTTWLRKNDFDGYYSLAGHPVALAPSTAGTISRQYPTSAFEFALIPLLHDTSLSDDGQLTLYDFPDLQNCYFGALLMHKTRTSQMMFATGTRLTSATLGSVSVRFSVGPFSSLWGANADGTYSAYFFFSNNAISQGTSRENATLYPIPGVKVQEVTIVNSGYEVSIRAIKSNTANTITAYYTIINHGPSAVTFQTNEMRCRYASASWNSPAEDGYETAQNKSLGAIVVPGGGTPATGTVTFTNIAPELFGNCKIWGWFGSEDNKTDPVGVYPMMIQEGASSHDTGGIISI